MLRNFLQQSGLLRLKHVEERRPGLPRENALTFYPRFIVRLVRNNFKLIQTVWWMVQLKRHIEKDPNRFGYLDQALTPVQDDEDASLDLLTKTDGGLAAVAHQRKVERLTHLVPAE